MVITKDTYLPSYEDLEVEEIKLSSPALKAGATHFGLYCDDVSKEYMLCRSEEKDPRRCLKEGKDVTACGLEFFRKIKTFCYAPFEAHWHCLENKSPELNPNKCRKTQFAFDACVREHLNQERPQMGRFAQVRIHDSTSRPPPPRVPIKDYSVDAPPSLPDSAPRPNPQGGSRAFGGLLP